jgi:hypothetical protein
LDAKSLDATHYQSFYANVLEAVDGFDGEIEAIVYLPYANKTTQYDFLLVMNRFSPDEHERLIGPIPFEALDQLVYDKAMKEGRQQLLVQKKAGLKHQIFYVDDGFTAGQCTSRQGHNDGILLPFSSLEQISL